MLLCPPLAKKIAIALPSLFLASLLTAQEGDSSGGFLDETRDAASTLIQTVDPVIELFDTQLPRTLSRYNLELSLDPKFRDVLDEDQIRLPIQVRYGVTDRLEVYTEIEPFVRNYIRHHGDHGWSYLRYGGKYQLPLPFRLLRTAVGIDVEMPLDYPPDAPSDGYLRVEPYITFERPLERFENTDVFLNLSYEFAAHRGGYNHPDSNIFDGDNARVTAGFIHYRGWWNPFFRAQYRWEVHGTSNTHFDGRVDAWFVEPGVMFDLPREWTRWLPGKWKVESGLRWEVWDDKGEFELNVRVKWRVTRQELGLSRS